MLKSLTQKLDYSPQIPRFEIFKWGKKENETCLIIPVKNEGIRIINLLKTINQLNIHKSLDIIIVDGGSDDKFFELKILKTLC